MILLGDLAELDDGGEGLTLRREVAALASELGEWAKALAHWATLGDRLGGATDRALAFLGAAHAAYQLERAVEAHAFLARYRALDLADPLLEIEADAREAQVLRWLEDRTEEAERPGSRAASAGRDLVEQAGGPDRLDDSERRAYLAALRAEMDGAILSADADAVGRLADQIGLVARDPQEALDAALEATFVLFFFEGTPALAEPAVRRVLEESRRLLLPAVETEATLRLGGILAETGDLEEAEKMLWQAVELPSVSGHLTGTLSPRCEPGRTTSRFPVAIGAGTSRGSPRRSRPHRRRTRGSAAAGCTSHGWHDSRPRRKRPSSGLKWLPQPPTPRKPGARAADGSPCSNLL